MLRGVMIGVIVSTVVFPRRHKNLMYNIVVLLDCPFGHWCVRSKRDATQKVVRECSSTANQLHNLFIVAESDILALAVAIANLCDATTIVARHIPAQRRQYLIFAIRSTGLREQCHASHSNGLDNLHHVAVDLGILLQRRLECAHLFIQGSDLIEWPSARRAQ